MNSKWATWVAWIDSRKGNLTGTQRLYSGLRFGLLSVVLFALLTTILPQTSLAQTVADRSDDVEAGKDVLRGNWLTGSPHPWYDKSTDGVRMLPVRVPKPSSTLDWNMNWFQDFTSYLESFDWRIFNFNINLLQIVTFFVVLAVVALIAYLGYRLYQSRTAPQDAALGDDVDDEEDLAAEAMRIEALPFDVAPQQRGLLESARDAADRGDYGTAIVYLYSYMLVQLDKHQKIHLAKGKTNRQYLREVRQSRPLATTLEQSMVAFEDFFFGHHEIPKERFDSCWNLLGNFRATLGQST